jgi:hypothetical protein
MDCYATTKSRHGIARCLAGVSKLGLIKNNIRIHNIFRERSHKYTSDPSRNRNIFIREFLRKKKLMDMNEKAVHKNVLSCANKPTTPHLEPRLRVGRVYH